MTDSKRAIELAKLLAKAEYGSPHPISNEIDARFFGEFVLAEVEANAKLRKQVGDSRLYAQKLAADCAVYREALEFIDHECMHSEDNCPTREHMKAKAKQAISSTDAGEKLLAVVKAAEQFEKEIKEKGASMKADELFAALKAYRDGNEQENHI